MALQASYEFSQINLGTLTHWDIYYVNSNYGTDTIGNASESTGLITDDFCRASRQYDSPLLNGEEGCGWKVLSYLSSEGGSPGILKVYKPIGATRIVIHGTYTPSGEEPVGTTLTMNFVNSYHAEYSSMIITVAMSNSDKFPEVDEHIFESAVSNIAGFEFSSHDLQINGSNFNVSQRDYMDSNKCAVNGLEVRAIPNYSNISMTRTFQKFMIGGYKKV